MVHANKTCGHPEGVHSDDGLGSWQSNLSISAITLPQHLLCELVNILNIAESSPQNEMVSEIRGDSTIDC